MSDTPTLGRIVQYRQRHGMQSWLAAVVTMDEANWAEGFWADPATEEGSQRLRLNNVNHANAHHAVGIADADGEVWTPAALPKVKPGRVHLKVFSPLGSDYHEFNVAEGDDPGCWRWPPRA